MEVDDDDVRVAPRLGDEVVDDLERPDWDVEEEPPHQVQDGDRRPVLRLPEREPASGRAGGEVRGADDALRLVEVGPQVVPGPDVVAERDDVGAGGEDPVGELGRQAATVRDVLAVHDAEVGFELGAQIRQARLDRTPSRRAEDVGEEEDSQRSASVAAG